MVNCLVFSICCFRLCKKMMFTKLSLNKKKWMMLEIVDKNVFKIMALPNNFVLICSFKTIILCSVHSIRFVKMCFLLKYGSWKPQLKSWNTNHEPLNRTLYKTYNNKSWYGCSLINNIHHKTLISQFWC